MAQIQTRSIHSGTLRKLPLVTTTEGWFSKPKDSFGAHELTRFCVELEGDDTQKSRVFGNDSGF